MLARIFIDRPILACVPSIVILLLGGIAAGLLPIAEYPQVTPPIVRVSAVYPGADAKVVADTIAAPVQITRYNMYPTASINGLPLPGTSMGDALASMERLAKDLPRTMTYEWTEVSYLQKQASKIEQFRDLRNNPFSAFTVGVILVFFVLAGLYESWSTPLAVILVVPMCLLSALIGLALAGYDFNIFVQVGFVVLVGLAAKNAILIVQFARDQEQAGASLIDATVEAARERLRPILMTSFAFILGVFPLVIAEGAGHEMRRTLGMAVFAGMIGVTLFGLFLTPVFYYVVRRLIRGRTSTPKAPESGSASPHGGALAGVNAQPLTPPVGAQS